MGFFGRDKDRDKDHRPPVPGGPHGVGDLMAMAKLMQAAAIEQRDARQHASAGGAPMGSTDWLERLSGILAGPQPGYVRRCTCRVCGAPKKLPSVTAYVYCDYCGSLADFDLHRACHNSTLPGPEYAAVVNGLQPQLRAARSSGDQDQYRGLQRQLFTTFVAHCPNSVSHRAQADPTYRDQYIAYLAEGAVVRAFDPEATRLEQEMVQRVVGLRWSGSLVARQVAPESFWPMTEVLGQQIEVDRALYRKGGVDALDPDKADFLVEKMAWSAFCQGWLPYLPPDAAEQLLTSHGLVNQYIPVTPEPGPPRSCSGCGGKIHALPGAKVVVCDTCGRRLDVATAALTCPSCGGSMSLPVGAANAACPFCHTDVERVGVL